MDSPDRNEDKGNYAEWFLFFFFLPLSVPIIMEDSDVAGKRYHKTLFIFSLFIFIFSFYNIYIRDNVRNYIFLSDIALMKSG